MIQYRTLCADELCRELFSSFRRRQVVTQCWQLEQGQWRVNNHPFIDDWSEEDYAFLVTCLKNTIATGGFVYGAFAGGKLKGFTSVEAQIFGGSQRYLELSCIHVSQELRRQGVGTALFRAAKAWAKRKGAAKLYISAHTAVETQAFYLSMGCTDAAEPRTPHPTPIDRQLECKL